MDIPISTLYKDVTTTYLHDIIQNSEEVRRALYIRITELQLSWSDVVRDASKRRHNINITKFTEWINGKINKGFPQRNILWLCLRYCIRVKLNVTMMQYNEERAIERIQHKKDFYRVKNK